MAVRALASAIRVGGRGDRASWCGSCYRRSSGKIARPKCAQISREGLTGLLVRTAMGGWDGRADDARDSRTPDRRR